MKSRVLSRVILGLSQWSIWPSKSIRPKLVKIAGVNFEGIHNHIGEKVIFDTLHPDFIYIGDHTTIAMRTTILTHYMKPNPKKYNKFESGEVHIGNHVFISAHTCICAPVKIGDYAVIAAGSIVTKNIPAGEIWGGVPARFLKVRDGVPQIIHQ